MRKRNIIIAISLFLLIIIVVVTATTVSILNEKVVYHNNEIMSIAYISENNEDIVEITCEKEGSIEILRVKKVKTVYLSETEWNNLDKENPKDYVEDFKWQAYIYPNNKSKSVLLIYYKK